MGKWGFFIFCREIYGGIAQKRDRSFYALKRLFGKISRKGIDMGG
jgi:hypothetical protein